MALFHCGNITGGYSTSFFLGGAENSDSGTNFRLVVCNDLYVDMYGGREVFKGLQMHASSRNYAPRVISHRQVD